MVSFLGYTRESIQPFITKENKTLLKTSILIFLEMESHDNNNCQNTIYALLRLHAISVRCVESHWTKKKHSNGNFVLNGLAMRFITLYTSRFTLVAHEAQTHT